MMSLMMRGKARSRMLRALYLTDKGFHSARLSNNCWVDLWADFVIDQSTMCSIKSLMDSQKEKVWAKQYTTRRF